MSELHEETFPVVVVVEHHGISFLAVASSTSCFLEVCFEAGGTVFVYHQSHVGFVDAHAEGVGGHHGSDVASLPCFLPLVFVHVVESGVIGSG